MMRILVARLFLYTAFSFVAAALLAAAVLWPTTHPTLIHVKALAIGSRMTYGPLASDDSRWETVLHGVASGDSSWLRVASDLEPALDTHPGEEMIGAVSQAFDKNPFGALTILLPRYGEGIVCGQEADGGAISRDKAHQRLHLLETLPLTAVDGLAIDRCHTVLTAALQTKASSK
jgi:hypothetical protein